MPDCLLAIFDRTVPAGVRKVYRAGTPRHCPGQLRKALMRLGLGLPGAHVASLHAPWLLVCLGLPARLTLATCRAGRSATVPHKEPGRRPGTPANGTHAPRVRFCVLFAIASAVRRRLWRRKPSQINDSFASAIPLAAYRSGQCTHYGVLGALHMGAAYSCSPLSYGDSFDRGQIAARSGLRTAAQTRSSPQTVRSSRTVVRCDSHRVGRRAGHWAFALSCEGSLPEGSPSAFTFARNAHPFRALCALSYFCT